MNTALVLVMLLAAVGLVLSIVAHIAALADIASPIGSFVWALHIGIFVVWLPTVLVATRVTRGANRKDFWKIMLSGCPAWMRQALYMLFAYAILNFVWFAFTNGGRPQPSADAPPAVIRGFSGHWMIFYGAAFATLYSVFKRPDLLRQRKCPDGHFVSVTDDFCPSCGRPVA